MLEKQQHIGYFYTRHDTIVIEDISVVSLVKRNGNKGKDIAIFHLKTLAVANSDTLLMSNRPSFHKNKDWDNKKWEVFYRPTKYAKY